MSDFLICVYNRHSFYLFLLFEEAVCNKTGQFDLNKIPFTVNLSQSIVSSPTLIVYGSAKHAVNMHCMMDICSQDQASVLDDPPPGALALESLPDKVYFIFPLILCLALS